MPSSWSSRLLASASSSATDATRNNEPLPRPPQTTRQHAHNRSASNPLPKIFGRKKSHANINDTDVPLKTVDDDGKATRRCMCCDNRVKVPKDLSRFRCMACLTINDLRAAEEQSEEDRQHRPSFKRADSCPSPLPATLKPKAPLTVERTLAIIDQCVVRYLEARCRRPRAAGPTELTSRSPKDDVFGPDQLPAALGIDVLSNQPAALEAAEVQVSQSSPDATREERARTTAPTELIQEYDDFDRFSGTRLDTPPPEGKLTSGGPGSPVLIPRKAMQIPTKPNRQPPPPSINMSSRRPSAGLLPHSTSSFTQTGQASSRPHRSPRLTADELAQRRQYDRIKTIFRPLEDYIQSSFGDFSCVNTSFSTVRQTTGGRARSTSDIAQTPPEGHMASYQPNPVDGLSELDAKTLLLGDIGENGTWWTGKLDRAQPAVRRKKADEGLEKAVNSKTPNINWSDVRSWYHAIHKAGEDWRSKVAEIGSENRDFSKANIQGHANAEVIDDDISDAREHAIRTLLKITENLLKRPSKPLKEPEDIRWLLIMLENPSLYPSSNPVRSKSSGSRYVNGKSSSQRDSKARESPVRASPKRSPGRMGPQHNGLLKRIFGLLSNAPEVCHRYLIGWFSRFDELRFVRISDLVASFVTYRVDRRSGRPRRASAVVDGGLIPDLTGGAMNTSSQLHAAMGLSGSIKKGVSDSSGEPDWCTDWQMKAAARVMAMLFSANNIWQGQRSERGPSDTMLLLSNGGPSPAAKAKRSGQLLHTSSFYNTLLDYQDMIADFRVWESKREKFSFCQYPLFLSIGTKIKILEYDARRQMEIKAREAYFDQVIRARPIDGHFHLRIRRECMVDDSLRQISEAVGSGSEELKKGLRVHFTGEEGVDAGGPRKEWFLMIVRDVFDPNHGMFVYDDESNTCYFNPNSFETSDQYYLVGALLGLAIYNSTILDVALPPFAFRKLLAAAPSSITFASNSNVSSITGTKGQMTYTLQDLAEFQPSLAAGLQQLLDFDGDVETTYCRDFVASVTRYGAVSNVPLVPNGENTPVTNANRTEFVDAYVRYLLDTAVSRQFEPFKRGFFTVCAGNALSLFRAEEIELLIRGSDENLDVDSLRAVAQYENWRHFQPPHQIIPNPAESVPVVSWFWELFAEASPQKQRKLLTFITGTDRIPAVGATSLILRIQSGGDGWGGGGPEERARFPIARTCFNMLVLWRYDYREQLEEKLWRAVDESEGFGLK